jgi:hypothetical protein
VGTSACRRNPGLGRSRPRERTGPASTPAGEEIPAAHAGADMGQWPSWDKEPASPAVICCAGPAALYVGLSLECRPRRVYSGPRRYNPAQPCCLSVFQYSCIYNLIYNVYVSHNKGVLWYTRGYIPNMIGKHGQLTTEKKKAATGDGLRSRSDPGVI